MPDIALFAPHQIISPGDPGPPPLEQYQLRFLAQGDSWFSIGAWPPMLTTNLFDQLELPVLSCAVNCASPGMKLRRMTDTTRQREFLNLLNGKAAHQWTGVLLSGGGTDLIEALQAKPTVEAKLRLLAPESEWGAHPPKSAT